MLIGKHCLIRQRKCNESYWQEAEAKENKT